MVLTPLWRKQFWLSVVLVTAIGLAAGCRRDDPTPAPALASRPAATALLGATPVATAAAATPAPSRPPVAATPTPAAGAVTLWHSWSGADGDALANILTRFLALNPQIDVETLFVAYNDLPQAYADAVAAGGGPDLVLSPSWYLQELAAAGAVLPIDDLVPPDGLAAYMPAARESLSVDGVLYGLPTNYELVGLYYNRNLISTADLPRTLEMTLSLANSAPSLGVGIYLNLYHIYWGIPAFGSTLFDDAGRVVLDQGPGAGLFLDWLKRAGDTEGSYVVTDYGMLVDRFKQGEFAFFVDGPWSMGELSGALGNDLAIGLLPAGPGGPARPWLSADGLFFNPNNSPEQQALALHLALHLTGGESGTQLAQGANRIPANLAADVAGKPLLQGFIRQAGYAVAEPHRPEMAQVWGYTGDMLIKALNGAAGPNDAVREAAALINEANGK